MQDAGSTLFLESLDLVVVHRTVGSAKIHGAFRNLLDPATGTNRLVIELNVAKLIVVNVEPLGINRIRKSRARAVDEQWIIRQHDGAQRKSTNREQYKSFHEMDLPKIRACVDTPEV